MLLAPKDLGLTHPGYILPPHPRLLRAGAAIEAYWQTGRTKAATVPSRRIGPIRPDSSPRDRRPSHSGDALFAERGDFTVQTDPHDNGKQR